MNTTVASAGASAWNTAAGCIMRSRVEGFATLASVVGAAVSMRTGSDPATSGTSAPFHSAR